MVAQVANVPAGSISSLRPDRIGYIISYYWHTSRIDSLDCSRDTIRQLLDLFSHDDVDLTTLLLMVTQAPREISLTWLLAWLDGPCDWESNLWIDYLMSNETLSLKYMSDQGFLHVTLCWLKQCIPLDTNSILESIQVRVVKIYVLNLL
jgi:hypothetical protein